MDGYGYGYPPGSTPDYSSPPMQRPASQTNAPSPHPGKSGGFCISRYLFGAGTHLWCEGLTSDAMAGGQQGGLCVNGTHMPPQLSTDQLLV
jgi:hypothetical protein